jgi:hypothetical protein
VPAELGEVVRAGEHRGARLPSSRLWYCPRTSRLRPGAFRVSAPRFPWLINFVLFVLVRRDRDEEAAGSAAAQDGGRAGGVRAVPA